MTMPDVFDLVNSAPPSAPSGDVFDLVLQPPRRRPSLVPAAESTRQTGDVQPNAQARSLPEPLKSVADYLVNPAMENPLTTAAAVLLPPVGLYMAGQGAKRVVQYGAQKAAEQTLPEDTRAMAEADPERIPGREAATLAAAFAAAPLIHTGVKALRRAPAPTLPSPTAEPVVKLTPRVPAEQAAARLAQAARPQAVDAPVSTAAVRELIAELDAVLEPARVKPKEAAPATTEVFPEGYQTKNVGRRPASATRPASGDVFDLVLEKEPAKAPEPPKAAEPTPTIGEPVSFGRDPLEPGRLPADVPQAPRLRGKNPKGAVVTPGDAVSVGPAGPKVTAETMLDVGKRRAAELEQGIAPRALPDLDAALHRVGRQFAETPTDPALPIEPVAPAKVKSTSPWKDLSEAPDDVLRAEAQRIRELHAQEEASVAFMETPEWAEWQNLPDKEKLGRSTRTTDEFGNKIKRQQEDLPDATMDPDVLAERRKLVSAYKKRTLVRNAEVQRAASIEAELARRAEAMESPPELPPPDEASAMPPPTVGVEGVPVAPVEGTGTAKTRGLAQGVNEKAVANKLTTSLGDLPEFQSVSMADQAAKATKLLAEDADRARRIALGDEVPPADLLPESVFVAVENRAIAEGDVATLRALASGDLTSQATTMGQRIRTLAERDPESPVAAIQKVVEARTRGAKNAKAATEASVVDLQRHIADAVKMDPPAWKSFIDSIRC